MKRKRHSETLGGKKRGENGRREERKKGAIERREERSEVDVREG